MKNGATGCPIAPCGNPAACRSYGRLTYTLHQPFAATSRCAKMLHGTYAAPAFGWRLQAVGADLARLVIRIGLGIDLGGVLDVAQGLGLRLVRIDAAARCLRSATEQCRHRHRSDAKQGTLQQGTARKLLFRHLSHSPRWDIAAGNAKILRIVGPLRDSTPRPNGGFFAVQTKIMTLMRIINICFDCIMSVRSRRLSPTLHKLSAMPDPRRSRLKTSLGIAVSVLLASVAAWVLMAHVPAHQFWRRAAADRAVSARHAGRRRALRDGRVRHARRV